MGEGLKNLSAHWCDERKCLRERVRIKAKGSRSSLCLSDYLLPALPRGLT